MKLSKSQAHYIRAVYELTSNDGNGARVCDVAEKLNVSKASASLAMAKLAQQGLVCKDADRHVNLTADGECHAVSMLDKYAVIYRFLTNILQINEAVAAADACAMEHVVSADTICAICRFGAMRKSIPVCSKQCHYRLQSK